MAILAAICTASWASPARACSCEEFGNPGAFEEAKAVFIGQVRAVRERGCLDGYALVTVDVERSWKGVPPEIQTLTFYQDTDASSCGISLEPKHRYLIYAGTYSGPDACGEPNECFMRTNQCLSTIESQSDEFDRSVETLDAAVESGERDPDGRGSDWLEGCLSELPEESSETSQNDVDKASGCRANPWGSLPSASALLWLLITGLRRRGSSSP